MKIIYLSFMFLFAREIRSVLSPAPGAKNLDSAGSRRSNSSPELPTNPSSAPCDRSKVESRASDANLACRYDCMILKVEIQTMYNLYPEYKSVQFLQDTCGMATEGKCVIGKDPSFPICVCYFSKKPTDQRRMTLSNCWWCVKIILQFINARTVEAGVFLIESVKKRIKDMEADVEGVAMHQFPPSRPSTGVSVRPPSQLNPYAPSFYPDYGNRPVGSSAAVPSASSLSRPQTEAEDFNTKPDGELEGNVLVTDVRVPAGNIVRAILDTGAEFSIIHRKFAGQVVRFDMTGLGASYQMFKIHGKTTIDLGVRQGITVPITGLVTDRKYELLLGNDFFVIYGAQIKLLRRKMEIFSNQLNRAIIMTVKFRAEPVAVNMMTSHYVAYSRLEIFARVSGLDTRVVIDTASTLTMVNRNLVSQQTLHPADNRCSFGGSESVGFAGVTDVNIMIGSMVSLMVPALVPEFVPPFSMLMGNDFNKMCIEMIDYKTTSITFRIPTPSGPNRFKTPAFVNQRSIKL